MTIIMNIENNTDQYRIARDGGDKRLIKARRLMRVWFSAIKNKDVLRLQWIVLMCMLIPWICSAQITSSFSGGPGADSFDQFPGVAAEGWATPWAKVYNDIPVKTVVSMDNALSAEAAAYLEIEVSRTDMQEGPYGGVKRTFLMESVGSDSCFQVEFLIRLDSELENVSDILIHAGSEDVPNPAPLPWSTSWIIDGNASTKSWWIGPQSEIDSVDTGIPLVSGHVYRFQVRVFNKGNFDVSIQDQNSDAKFTSDKIELKNANKGPATNLYFVLSPAPGSVGKMSLSSIVIGECRKESK